MSRFRRIAGAWMLVGGVVGTAIAFFYLDNDGDVEVGILCLMIAVVGALMLRRTPEPTPKNLRWRPVKTYFLAMVTLLMGWMVLVTGTPASFEWQTELLPAGCRVHRCGPGDHGGRG